MTTTLAGSRWEDLPDDLLAAIGRRFDSRIDILRFRSVCNSWRSSVPLPNPDEQVPPVTVRLPYPVDTDGVLDQSTICNFQFLSPIQTSSSSSSSSQGSSSSSDAPPPQGWLMKAGESPRGKLLLSNPISNQKLFYSPIHVNLLDVRLVQLRNSFRVILPSGLPSFEVNRVVVFPPSASPRNNIGQLTLVAIYYEGKLGYWRSGDKTWTLIDDKNFEYDDIIPYRGQFYVVDRRGTVSWIDSSLKLIQYSPPLYGCGGQKNLVDSDGDLYVVDRYLDRERRSWKDVENAVVTHSSNPASFLRGRRRRRKLNPRAVDFRVYKLDEDWGTWVNVTSLGDRVFVLTPECSLSVSAAEFVKGKGNCIYYSDDDDYLDRGMLSSESVQVFQFEDRSIEKLGLLPTGFDIFLPHAPPVKVTVEAEAKAKADFIWRTCID
ncbi:Putative F-box protein At1g65770 [Linum grandiflorum]